jgi:hypothetical protein
MNVKGELRQYLRFNDPMGMTGDDIEVTGTQENERKRTLLYNDYYQSNISQDNETNFILQDKSVSTECAQPDVTLFSLQEGSMNQQQKQYSRIHPRLNLHTRKKCRIPSTDFPMPSIQNSYFDYDDNFPRGKLLSLSPKRVRQIDIVKFGHPCDEMIEGSRVYSRQNLLLLGAHKSDISCVNGNELLGCDSIIYVEEEKAKTKDCLCFIQYICSHRNGGGALFANYKLSKQNNAEYSYPIRVFRKIQDIHRSECFRYDGLYHIIAIYDDSGKPRSELCKFSKTFRFLFERNSVGYGEDQNRRPLKELFELVQKQRYDVDFHF